MGEDKKETFRMEIIKKAWFSQRFSMLGLGLPTIDVSNMRS